MVARADTVGDVPSDYLEIRPFSDIVQMPFHLHRPPERCIVGFELDLVDEALVGNEFRYANDGDV